MRNILRGLGVEDARELATLARLKVGGGGWVGWGRLYEGFRRVGDAEHC